MRETGKRVIRVIRVCLIKHHEVEHTSHTSSYRNIESILSTKLLVSSCPLEVNVGAIRHPSGIISVLANHFRTLQIAFTSGTQPSMYARRRLCVLLVSVVSTQRSYCFIYSPCCCSMKCAPSSLKRKSFSSSPVSRSPSAKTKMADGNAEVNKNQPDQGMPRPLESIFQESTVANAKTLTDGVKLNGNKNENVILPYIGFGTYKLGKEIARSKTLEALEQGYRCIDTAFVYGGETTENQVGLAIQGTSLCFIIFSRCSSSQYPFFAW